MVYNWSCFVLHILECFIRQWSFNPHPLNLFLFSFMLKILGSSPILSTLARQWSFAGAPVFFSVFFLSSHVKVFHFKRKVGGGGGGGGIPSLELPIEGWWLRPQDHDVLQQSRTYNIFIWKIWKFLSSLQQQRIQIRMRKIATKHLSEKWMCICFSPFNCL